MSNNTNDLSSAVVVFIGYGVTSWPCPNAARLAKQFGPKRAIALQTDVENLIAEVGKITLDWSRHTLSSAADAIRAEMGARHPELSEAALQALAWKFTFDWR